MTGANTEALKVRILDKIYCLYLHVQFRKNKGKNVLALLDFKSKINAITLVYTAYLSLKVRITNVGMQKIDSFLLAT